MTFFTIYSDRYAHETIIESIRIELMIFPSHTQYPVRTWQQLVKIVTPDVDAQENAFNLTN